MSAGSKGRRTRNTGAGAALKAYLEPSEVERLEQATTNLRDRLLIHILFHLGCRVSEALGLKVEDIDFDHGTVAIQHLKVRVRLSCSQCGARLGRMHNFCPKCGAKVEGATAKEQGQRQMRTLPLDSETLEMLEDYVRRGGPVTRKEENLIFGITRHRAWRVVTECARKGGCPLW